jgi:beta-galactosidase
MKQFLLLLTIFISFLSFSQPEGFEIKDGQFVMNGKPMRIYGGEMHYARIPRQYWRHRIQMAKAMGCNTLSVYVFWNYQETSPGVWDWRSDSRDLRAFVEIAGSEGMYIILRPGPYTCAEWEFGGFPYWLIDNPVLKLRSDNQAFLDSCRTYLQQVYRQVDGLFAEQGGHIIMTQVENEFGSYAFAMRMSKRECTAYLDKLTAIYREAGFTHTLFTCDGGIIPVINFARLGHVKGLFPGTNDSKFPGTAHHTVRKFYSRKGPYYIPEEYAGWFTHWGDAHVFHRDVEKYKTHIEALLKTDFSFCYYMVHGGTNFGFNSGTNYRRQNETWPIITSYDYGAPIDEAGNATPLYDSLRAVYLRVTHQALPPVPHPVTAISMDGIKLTGTYLLFDMIRGKSTSYHEPPTFERLGQASGYVLYEREFDVAQRSQLSTAGITDYALIYINDSPVATIDRNAPVGSVPQTITLDIPAHGTLKILVENMGRVNFGKKLNDNRRGVTQGIIMDGRSITDWQVTPIPMGTMPETSVRYTYQGGQPIFFTGSFEVERAGDTYLDMHGFGKGIVFVNGHNLGRYWEIGPQYSLYVPGVWLKHGRNDIVIFDQLNKGEKHSILTTAKPVNR